MSEDTDERGTPNPGSREARDGGCICPVFDNLGGRMAPRPPDGWWIVVGCPLHDPASVTARSKSDGSGVGE